MHTIPWNGIININEKSYKNNWNCKLLEKLHFLVSAIVFWRNLRKLWPVSLFYRAISLPSHSSFIDLSISLCPTLSRSLPLFLFSRRTRLILEEKFSNDALQNICLRKKNYLRELVYWYISWKSCCIGSYYIVTKLLVLMLANLWILACFQRETDK